MVITMERRYLLVPQGFEKLRTESDTVRCRQFRRLTEQCAWYRKEELPLEHPMKSITYFGMAAANLALCYRLTGQAQYLEEARRWLFTAVSFPHWGRAVKVDVDLSAAWLLFGFGLSYDWLKDELKENERAALRQKLILQGGRMYDYARSARGESWPVEFWQNHNWIDYTGLAAAGYALREEYPPAAEWIAAAKADMTKVFPLLPEDGSDYEGVTYWRYGVIWLLQYAELLRETEGIDLFRGSDFLRNTFFYRLYQTAPDLEQNFNFGDCHDRRSGHSVAMYYKLASEYRIGQAQWLAEWVEANALWREGYESGLRPGLLPEAFLELLWYDPGVRPESVNALPTVRCFPDLGLVSARSGWDSRAFAISFKCASGGGKKQWALTNRFDHELGYPTRSMGHHHPDANSFQAIRGSDYLAVDEGYSAHKMAAHHNLVLVDGLGYEGDGDFDVYRDYLPERTAELENFGRQGGCVYMRGESSRMYHRKLRLTGFWREILTIGRSSFIVCDRLTSESTHTYTWLLHADQPFLPADGGGYRMQNGASGLAVLTQEGVVCRTELTSVRANPTSQEPSLIITTHMHTLCVENREPAREFVFFNVLLAGSALEGTRPEAQVLEKPWGRVVVLQEEVVRLIAWNPQNRPLEEELEAAGSRWRIRSSSRWSVWEIQDGGAVCQAQF